MFWYCKWDPSLPLSLPSHSIVPSRPSLSLATTLTPSQSFLSGTKSDPNRFSFSISQPVELPRPTAVWRGSRLQARDLGKDWRERQRMGGAKHGGRLSRCDFGEMSGIKSLGELVCFLARGWSLRVPLPAVVVNRKKEDLLLTSPSPPLH